MHWCLSCSSETSLVNQSYSVKSASNCTCVIGQIAIFPIVAIIIYKPELPWRIAVMTLLSIFIQGECRDRGS